MLALSAFLPGCDETPPPEDSGLADAGPDGAALDGGAVCARNADCEDTLFCTEHACMPGAPAADARGCVLVDGPCTAAETCMEATSMCMAAACGPVADVDVDGEDSMACGGNDCDDDDGRRFPGAQEVCDGEGLDEDCNPDTFASDTDGDLDDDGFTSALCCNGASCGDDCNDLRTDVNPGRTELCNAIDDDCDGLIDEAGAFCPAGTCISSRCRSVNWERVYGSVEVDGSSGVVADSEGNLFAGVFLRATGGDIDENGAPDPPGHYVVSIAPDGRLRWVANTIGGGALALSPDGLWFSRVAGSAVRFFSTTDGSLIETREFEPFDEWTDVRVVGGNVVGMEFVVTVELHQTEGTFPLELRVRSNLLLVRLDAERRELGRRTIETSGTLEVRAVAGSPGGFFMISLLSSEPTAVVEGSDALEGRFVTLLDGTLDRVIWQTSGLGIPSSFSVGVAEDGASAIAGCFEGEFSPPWTTETWLGTDGGGCDAFVSSFAPDGSHWFTRVHSGPETDANRHVTYDNRGNLFVAGAFSGDMNVSPRATLTHAPAGSDLSDGYYVLLGREDGFVVDARAISGSQYEEVSSILVDPFGGLLLQGTFGGTVELPSGGMHTASEVDVFLLRISDL